ncbi:hypothetical protein [Streptomyces poonensis]|uniref:Uncharacterized protein n=1 Tax=Streptomyces poonensis TaxID=68255 RepID=A0A918PC11_9ACTN|nr:hypothetical protein [Streptomyces poonensis]GGY97990.1 hypothetical protein GCM10010365_15690 [Streptomyces poonensis]
MLPPVGTSPDQYAQRAGDRDDLFLVLDDDGTVRGHRGPCREVFATQDLDRVLYFAAEEAVRHLAEYIVARSPGHGPVANLVTGQAEMLDEIDPAWGSAFRGGGMDGTRTAQPCGRDPWERLARIAGSWREQAPYTTLAFFARTRRRAFIRMSTECHAPATRAAHEPGKARTRAHTTNRRTVPVNGFLMTVLAKAAMALAEAIVVRLALELWDTYVRSRGTSAPATA